LEFFMRLADLKAVHTSQQTDQNAPKLENGQRAEFEASAIQLLLEAVVSLPSIDRSLKRIADKLDPNDDKPVGTPYVAQRLGTTTTWVAEMARTHVIPKSCLVAGTGVGKPWKFHKAKIDEWLESR
jgi:hypothetical protein